MNNSKIEWTTHTFNPWEGCMKVSPGCKNCYACSRDAIWHIGKHWGPNSPRKKMSESYWRGPVKWDAINEKNGTRERVFCASLADVFEAPDTLTNPEAIAVVEAARMRLFRLMFDTPNLDWLLLTKRPANIYPVIEWAHSRTEDLELRDWLASWIEGNYPHNVWLGTSVENQDAANERIPELIALPAAIRFLSCEPLLGRVDLRKWISSKFITCMDVCPDTLCDGSFSVETIGTETESRPICPHCGIIASFSQTDDSSIDWVISGGESGHGARPMHPEWARSLQDQCESAGVAFFFKQWGEYVSVSEVAGEGDHYTFPDGATVRKTGKKAAGRTLDGEEYNQFPSSVQ